MNSARQPSILLRDAGIYVVAIFTIVHALGLVLNFKELDAIALLTSSVVFILRIIYFNRFRDFSLNLSRVMLWILWDVSMVIMPVVFFGLYVDTVYPNAQLVISSRDINFSIKVGSVVLIIHFIISYFFKNDKFSESDYFPSITEGMFWTLAVLGGVVWFCALVAARYFGTGMLGVEGNVLPYKMSGFINYFAYYFSSFYVLFLLDGVLKYGRNILLALIPIAFLAVLSAYVSLSKGALILPMIMCILYMIMSRRLAIFHALLVGSLLLVAFIGGSYITSFRDSLHSIRYKSWNELTADYGALDYLHRIFREGITFQKFHAYADTVDLKQELKSYNNNPSDLHTYAIDKTPLNTMHSSGCSTLVSAYCFGLQYVLILTVFMSLVSLLIDYWLPRTRWVMSSILFRTYTSYYVTILMFNSMLVHFVAPLFGMGGSLITGVLIPISIFVIYILYLSLFCRKAQIVC